MRRRTVDKLKRYDLTKKQIESEFRSVSLQEDSVGRYALFAEAQAREKLLVAALLKIVSAGTSSNVFLRKDAEDEAITILTGYAAEKSSTNHCEYCGPICYGGAEHNERDENGDRFNGKTGRCTDTVGALVREIG
jgi:hypothetical protein